MPRVPAWSDGRRRALLRARLFCRLAGACELAIGVLLMLDPAATLALMGIGGRLAEPVYLRLAGAFVAAVGLVYLYPFLTADLGRRLPVVIEVTALVRTVVAAFVAAAVAARALAPGWLLITAFDAGLAAVQIVLLRRGMFDHDGDAI
jgi:hypothetical protein